MLKKYLLLFLISTCLLFSMSKEEIKPHMTKQINSVVDVLKNKELNKEAKAEKIISIMDPLFDYTLMSRLSLGKFWKTLEENQKDDFTSLFIRVLKNSYINKLGLYTNEKVQFLGIQEPKKNRVVLNTLLVGEKDKFDIDYKFYQKAQDDWKIYDINLLGVSIIQTYRQQFAGFLKDKSFDELLIDLKNKQ